MSRWMALDVGRKTIGVALSDSLKLTARPLLTLDRRDPAADARQIMDLLKQYKVDRLIIGRPLHLDGTPSATLELIEPLFDELQQGSSIDVDWAEERLSTREANRRMAEAGVPLSERRRKRNEYAAAVILTWYIQEKSFD